MAKKLKTKEKRTVTCGKCSKQGHNARSCKAAVAEVVTPAIEPEVVTEVVAEVVKSPVTEVVVEPTAEKPKVNLKAERPRREAPTADHGTAATAAPFRCTKCNSVAILAIVRVTDHTETYRKGKTIYKGEMRCEQCLNKPAPAELILVWGANPGDTVTSEVANAER